MAQPRRFGVVCRARRQSSRRPEFQSCAVADGNSKAGDHHEQDHGPPAFFACRAPPSRLLAAGAAGAPECPAEPAGGATVEIDDDEIGGVVTSRFGPEAGVWVIAETTELGTRFAKMVVTDERGRYVIPDLPEGEIPGLGARLWPGRFAEGRRASPGKHLNLTAVVAPNLAAAAQYYPAIYWCVDDPDSGPEPVSRHRRQRQRHPGRSSRPRTSGSTSSRPTAAATATRSAITRPAPSREALGHFEFVASPPGRAACSRGRPGTDMVRIIAQLMTPDGGHLAALADWTDRIKAGELPSATPPRPTGIERNIVVTVRDWLDPKHYLHDLTRDRQAQSDRQRLWADLRRGRALAPTTCRCSIRCTTPRP